MNNNQPNSHTALVACVVPVRLRLQPQPPGVEGSGFFGGAELPAIVIGMALASGVALLGGSLSIHSSGS